MVLMVFFILMGVTPMPPLAQAASPEMSLWFIDHIKGRLAHVYGGEENIPQAAPGVYEHLPVMDGGGTILREASLYFLPSGLKQGLDSVFTRTARAVIDVFGPQEARADWSGDAEDADRIHFFHTDHLGSTRVVTDAVGDIYEKTDYLPFGEIMYDTKSEYEMRREKYTGQMFDYRTGLYYYGARYYDPETGRFTQADTIVPNPFDGQTFNRYTYTNNNPTSYNDPTGHATGLLAFSVGALFAAVGFAIGFTFGLFATGSFQGAFAYGGYGAQLGWSWGSQIGMINDLYPADPNEGPAPPEASAVENQPTHSGLPSVPMLEDSDSILLASNEISSGISSDSIRPKPKPPLPQTRPKDPPPKTVSTGDKVRDSIYKWAVEQYYNHTSNYDRNDEDSTCEGCVTDLVKGNLRKISHIRAWTTDSDKCNMFVADALIYSGAVSESSIIGKNYNFPSVNSFMALAKDGKVLHSIDQKEAGAGDIVAWSGGPGNAHHIGIVGVNGTVISAGAAGISYYDIDFVTAQQKVDPVYIRYGAKP